MLDNKAKAFDQFKASVAVEQGSSERVKAGGFFVVECFDKDGNLKWKEENHNLVVNVGLQDMNAKYFTGSSYTAAWYIGLYGALMVDK